MAYNIHHPSSIIDQRLITILRNVAPDAEQLFMLHPAQLDIIYAHQWFKLFVPAELGGLQLSLPQVLKLEEALSWVDGSLAWVVTLCAGAGWFVGFIPQTVSEKLFRNEKLCLAGSGAVNGYADLTQNGFIVNGSWPYASGAMHATAFTANCLIRKNNQQVYKADGSSQVAAFILNSQDVELKQTWKTMGMCTTGSHAFEVSNLLVPIDRTFIIDPDHAVLNHPVYQYPFLQLAETTLAVNMSGMALRFIELIELELAQGKIKKTSITCEVNDTLSQVRETFFETASESWEMVVKDKVIPMELLSKVSQTSQELVRTSKTSMNTLYPYGGLKAATTNTEINRIWRNFHTASQHALFNK
jgi:hypothetical protein